MTNLEETARRTCDFEETAMAGDEMAKDPEIRIIKRWEKLTGEKAEKIKR